MWQKFAIYPLAYIGDIMGLTKGGMSPSLGECDWSCMIKLFAYDAALMKMRNSVSEVYH